MYQTNFRVRQPIIARPHQHFSIASILSYTYMKNFIKPLFLAATIALFSFSSQYGKEPKYIDQANMDLSVKPGDNFYLYANGRWIRNNPVPASKTRWGSFNILRDESSQRLHTLLTDAVGKASSNPKLQKIGDFYASGMDTLAIEQLGYIPIGKDLQRINNLRDINDILAEAVLQRNQGIGNPLFGFSITPDRKNVARYIPSFNQGGTTLPDRDYYLKNDSRSLTIRKAYQHHLKTMFQMIGNNVPAAGALGETVLKIETALAKAQMARTELRDPYKTYNKFSIADLSATTPSIDWKFVLGNMRLSNVDSVIVSNPAFLRSADSLLSALPLSDWKAYLKWNVLSSSAPFLSQSFVHQNFLFAKVLSGQKEQTPRWERMGALIDRELGDLLGELYVAKHFKPEAKTRLLELVSNLQETFRSRIQKLDWMSEETKERALEKLNAFTKKIGYPDKWKDYGSIRIDRNDFFGNIRRVSEWSFNDMIARFGKPVDKTRWSMTPPTVNAYYNSTGNEIVFPAGILQFPFFDFGADDAINYGGIGTVIGHEIIHGFDDQGSKSAGDGNLTNWWAEDDEKKFKSRSDLVVKQYDGFTVLDTIHLNGRLTLGENLADLGGLSIAYEAFTKTKQFKEGKKIDGFTPAQRLFLNFAQIWRGSVLPETEAQLVLTDPHSPGMHRANGPVVNIDAWYDAFGVKRGDKMYKAPEDRIRIW